MSIQSRGWRTTRVCIKCISAHERQKLEAFEQQLFRIVKVAEQEGEVMDPARLELKLEVMMRILLLILDFDGAAYSHIQTVLQAHKLGINTNTSSFKPFTFAQKTDGEQQV